MSAGRDEAEVAHWVSQIINSDDTNRPGGYVSCRHHHRTGQTAAVCGARRVRRATACITTNPEHLPAVLGYSVTPIWSERG